jgi:hypothetical protein
MFSYKSVCKISPIQTTTSSMLAFVIVADAISFWINAMDQTFLALPSVIFCYHEQDFRISLCISGTCWKWRPSSCDFILRNKKKLKEDNSVPFSFALPVERRLECTPSSTDVPPYFNQETYWLFSLSGIVFQASHVSLMQFCLGVKRNSMQMYCSFKSVIRQ